MLSRVVVFSLAFSARASCVDDVTPHSSCSKGAYESKTVEDSDACCALCASETQCKSWTFGGLTRACERTSTEQEPYKSITTAFSTCGKKNAPSPPSPPPVPPTPGVKNTWAVIAAGSAGFSNYRHQADACHAYQILLKRGIPAQQIILMMQDDVANSGSNPFRGKLFNKPGSNATDVYDGCKVDYRGSIVTAKLFLSVITGDEAGVPSGGKVLKSGAHDRVFLNFVDHGGVGIVAFPNGPLLHVSELATALTTMRQKNMYSEVLFYMEACESGSMFPKLPTDSKVFAVTAANAKESSWGFYCGSDAVVDGKNIGSCLGDLFSISWMEDSDLADPSETIQTQVQRVTKRTNKSHVMTFGDTSFEAEPFSDFELKVSGGSAARAAASGGVAVAARDIPLWTATYNYENAETDREIQVARNALHDIVAARKADDAVFASIAENICGRGGCSDDVSMAMSSAQDWTCHMELTTAVHETCPRRAQHNAGGWNGYSMQFSQMLANACAIRQLLGKDVPMLKRIVHERCAAAAVEAASGAATIMI